jgi:ABC-type glycerol-3-phosphate transport system substrate-binding protein
MSHGRPARRDMLRGAVAAALATPFVARAQERPVRVLSHRYPALEYYTGQMRGAVPDVQVDLQLIPFDKMLELARIALSARSDGIDILYTTDVTVLDFARRGWLRPLDDLWARFRNEYALDDFADNVVKAFTVDGHIYVIPYGVTVMLLVLRRDLLDAAGLPIPRSIAQYRDLAHALNTPRRSGTVSCLKLADAALNEAHWYLNALGDGWFDANWQPLFATARSIAAIEMLRDVTRAAQPSFTVAGNDECTLTLQQDLAASGLQWVTRARAMDDPKSSRVVGQMEWIAPPQGGSRLSSDGYAISAFSRQDPETLFRIIAHSASEPVMRGAASLVIPPRRSLVADPALAGSSRSWRAAIASLGQSVPFPALADFYAVGDGIARRIQDAVTGQMTVNAAMALAADETATWLKQHRDQR